MFSLQKNLEEWQPAALPVDVTLAGRWVLLEPLSAARHAPELWQAVHGQDAVWTWLSDGPYANEEELARALLAKEQGPAARFFALRPHGPSHKPGPAVGYASLMRIDTANGVIEVGNVMFSPALQRTPRSY